MSPATRPTTGVPSRHNGVYDSGDECHQATKSLAILILTAAASRAYISRDDDDVETTRAFSRRFPGQIGPEFFGLMS